MCNISTNNLWWEGSHFLKNIVKYNNRKIRQTKIKIDGSLLNRRDERIVKTNSYLVTSEKKNFSTLKKLLIITWWVLRFTCNMKSKIVGKKLNLKNYLNSG